MQTLFFDNYGNLNPYEVIETDLQTFQTYFISKMENSEHRKNLFDDYLKYTKELSNIVSNSFYQWINGSYVTKKPTPRDIDLVSFIDYNQIKDNEDRLKDFIFPFSKEIYNVDAYIVKIYPDYDSNQVFSKSDMLYWQHHFQKTRPNKKGEKHYKGFIKIDLSHEKI